MSNRKGHDESIIAHFSNGILLHFSKEETIIKEAKTIPIPTPDPARAIVANPAPINLAACKIIFMLYFKYFVKQNFLAHL